VYNPSLEVALNTLLPIYSFQFRSVLPTIGLRLGSPISFSLLNPTGNYHHMTVTLDLDLGPRWTPKPNI